ncbi:MAG: hypothetical protein AB2L20_15795 [Mangrovibacterium sp.]
MELSLRTVAKQKSRKRIELAKSAKRIAMAKKLHLSAIANKQSCQFHRSGQTSSEIMVPMQSKEFPGKEQME